MHRRSTLNLILATIIILGIMALFVSIYTYNTEETAGNALPQQEVTSMKNSVAQLVEIAGWIFSAILLGTGAIWIYKKLSRGVF